MLTDDPESNSNSFGPLSAPGPRADQQATTLPGAWFPAPMGKRAIVNS